MEKRAFSAVGAIEESIDFYERATFLQGLRVIEIAPDGSLELFQAKATDSQFEDLAGGQLPKSSWDGPSRVSTAFTTFDEQGPKKAKASATLVISPDGAVYMTTNSSWYLSPRGEGGLVLFKKSAGDLVDFAVAVFDIVSLYKNELSRGGARMNFLLESRDRDILSQRQHNCRGEAEVYRDAIECDPAKSPEENTNEQCLAVNRWAYNMQDDFLRRCLGGMKILLYEDNCYLDRNGTPNFVIASVDGDADKIMMFQKARWLFNKSVGAFETIMAHECGHIEHLQADIVMPSAGLMTTALKHLSETVPLGELAMLRRFSHLLKETGVYGYEVIATSFALGIDALWGDETVLYEMHNQLSEILRYYPRSAAVLVYDEIIEALEDYKLTQSKPAPRTIDAMDEVISLLKGYRLAALNLSEEQKEIAFILKDALSDVSQRAYQSRRNSYLK